MVDLRVLDRLAAELHASPANRAALETGGYFLPVQVIRRTLELIVLAGVRGVPLLADWDHPAADRRSAWSERRAAS